MTVKAERGSSHSTGMAGCPCTDESGALASLVERSCEISEGRSGVMLTAEGPCVPHSYGLGCGRHDLIHDPKCALADWGEAGNADYCLRSWCYVDAATCRRSPSGRAFRSYYFPRDEGVDLFYSYTTCNSTADEWLSYEHQHVLGGLAISTIIPNYVEPIMYKRNAEGDIIGKQGSEYYNSSVPFEGSFINYLENLVDIAGGDFTINYTHGSEAGKKLHNSKWTGAVQDVQDGLVDMGAGPFWITGERLKLTTFTVPLFDDKIVLVIPRPRGSLNAQTQKVLEPFSLGVWGLVLGLIAVTAVLSVWVSTYKKKLNKKRVYSRLVLDEFLQKGTFFCSAGVEQDASASLPQKLLMFGFSFFILILVSSYVANLAAFLTRPVDYVGTIKQVAVSGIRVCAKTALKEEVQTAWPNVNFVFPERTAFLDIVNDYKAGKCDAIATGKFDVFHSVRGTKLYCDLDLVFTDSVFTENPVAFPIRPELAAGLSYWIHEGKKNHGITFEAAQEEYDEKHKREHYCNLEYSVQAQETNEYGQIKAYHLFFPVMFFVGFAVLAVIIQLNHQKSQSKGRRTVFGRPSSLLRGFSSLGFFGASHRTQNSEAERQSTNTAAFSHRVLEQDEDSEAALPQSTDHSATNIENEAASDVIQPEDRFDYSLEGKTARKSVLFALDENDATDRLDYSLKKKSARKSVQFACDEDDVTDRFDHGLFKQIAKSGRVACDDDDAIAHVNKGARRLREDITASRLQHVFERAFEEILDCMDEVKQQKKEG